MSSVGNPETSLVSETEWNSLTFWTNIFKYNNLKKILFLLKIVNILIMYKYEMKFVTARVVIKIF